MVCVCSACACALQPSRTAARGSRIPDLGSGIGESGAGCVGDLGRGHQRAYIRHHRDDSSPAASQRSIFIPNPHSKVPPTLGKGVGRRSPWESLGKERKPSAKGVTPSVKGVTIRKWAYDLGKKGATPAEKGAIQRAEGHRSTAGVDGTLPGLHGTWQTKSTKPPSKVTLSCPTAPLLALPRPIRKPSRATSHTSTRYHHRGQRRRRRSRARFRPRCRPHS